MSIDFLAIGHVARDVTPDGYRLGGTVTFAALTALNMGLRPAIVTSAGPDWAADEIGAPIPVHVVRSKQTTTFHNVQDAGGRRQTVTAVAGGPIGASDIPQAWRSARMVLLGPLAGEIRDDVATHFPDSIVVASLQGWLRSWDEAGRVTPKAWAGRHLLPHFDAAVLSRTDVDDHRIIDGWAKIVRVLMVTAGKDGSRLHVDGAWHEIPAFDADEGDPTGAGDVFAAAYLVRFAETARPLEAALFASCVAGFSVEAGGVNGIPTRAQVEERLEMCRARSIPPRR